MGLGDLILREIASSWISHHPVPKQVPTTPATVRLTVCKERQHVKRTNPQRVDQQARHTAATAIAALSVSWAPGAGIAKGFPPTSREAIEIAHIKQEEWPYSFLVFYKPLQWMFVCLITDVDAYGYYLCLFLL